MEEEPDHIPLRFKCTKTGKFSRLVDGRCEECKKRVKMVEITDGQKEE